MFFYLTVIALATISSFGITQLMKRSKVIGAAGAFCLIFSLALLASLRSKTVGYDFMFYCYNDFRNAINSESLYEAITSVRNEWAYTSVLYLASLVSSSVHSAMFFISFVTVGMSYVACLRMERYVPSWLLFAFFLSLHYVESFNLIRQTMAISASLLAFTFYKNRWGGWRFLLISIIAIGFHKTAMIPTAIFIVANVIGSMPEKKGKRYVLLFALGCIVLLIGLVSILQLLSSVHGFEKYATYGDTKGGTESWRKPAMSKLILTLMLICMFFQAMARKWQLYSPSVKLKFWVILIITTTGVLLGGYTGSAGRMSMYFYIVCLYYLCGGIYNSNIIAQRSKILMVIGISALLLSSFVKNRLGENYLSYHSEILGL